jgi:uncharacterized membrane protein
LIRTRRIIGAILAIIGVFLAIFYGYMAYSSQESYVRLGCVVEWISGCTAVNNSMMLGMGILGVSLVIISVGGIVMAKSRR